MKDFLRGMRSVITLFPHDRNIVTPPKHSDADAICSDWEKIGNDMRAAIEKNNLDKIQQKSHE